jgi:catechol 2,3-dioxygenase-like lactoylglutathione lyase family enzyme
MNIVQIKETCLYVRDLDRTEAFYRGLLGFPVIGRAEGRHVFFRAGSSVLLCFIAEVTQTDTKLPPHFGSGNLHLAFEVKGEEYQAWKEKMTTLGIDIVHEQEWKKGKHSFYFRDPDGHLLEILPEKGIWD